MALLAIQGGEMGKSKPPEETPGLIAQLKEQIRQSGQSLNQLSRLCGVDSARLSRFMTGQRGLSIEALDRLFKALHLKVERETPPGAAPQTSPEPPPSVPPARPSRKPKAAGPEVQDRPAEPGPGPGQAGEPAQGQPRPRGKRRPRGQ